MENQGKLFTDKALFEGSTALRSTNACSFGYYYYQCESIVVHYRVCENELSLIHLYRIFLLQLWCFVYIDYIIFINF